VVVVGGGGFKELMYLSIYSSFFKGTVVVVTATIGNVGN
jgi:hypothetical protein